MRSTPGDSEARCGLGGREASQRCGALWPVALTRYLRVGGTSSRQVLMRRQRHVSATLTSMRCNYSICRANAACPHAQCRPAQKAGDPIPSQPEDIYMYIQPRLQPLHYYYGEPPMPAMPGTPLPMQPRENQNTTVVSNNVKTKEKKREEISGDDQQVHVLLVCSRELRRRGH